MTNSASNARTVRTPAREGILARLLASQNLKVVHNSETQTAYFDLAQRTLVLPCWDVSRSVYDFLVGHEVGHAKHTPSARWKDAAIEIGGTAGARIAQDFINVVEDARIERQMKREFPGLRSDFAAGYKTLHEDMDIFQIKGKNLGSLRLIDRLNLHYKIGIHCGVEIPFTDEERVFLDRISEMGDGERGFEDAVKIAADLFKREQQRKRDLEDENGNGNAGGEGNDQEQGSEAAQGDKGSDQQKQKSSGKGDGTEDGKRKGTEDSAEDDTDDGSTAESREGEKGGEDQKSKGNEPSAQGEEQGEQELPDAPSTVGAMESAMHRFINQKLVEEEIKVRAINPAKVVVGVEKFIDLCDKGICIGDTLKTVPSPSVVESAAADAFKRVSNENKRGVEFMVKRFEVKRAARNFARQTSAKSGRISTRLLSKYKFSEDIFDRVTIKRDEKNHGIVILLDWSGSMSCMLNDTISQLVALIMFCRRVGIPAEVYFFSSQYSEFCEDLFIKNNPNLPKTKDYRGNETAVRRTDLTRWGGGTKGITWDSESETHAFTDHVFNLPQGTVAQGGYALLTPFSLIKVYDQNMDQRKMVRSLGRLILLGNLVSTGSIRATDNKNLFLADDRLNLGSTPLDESILAMREIVNNFRKSSNSKVTFVNLTDGEGTSIVSRYHSVQKHKPGIKVEVSRILMDETTNVRYDITENRTICAYGIDYHGITMQMFKDATGVQAVGIYMTRNSRTMDQVDYMRCVQRSLPTYGYDQNGTRTSRNEKNIAKIKDLQKDWDEKKFIGVNYEPYDMYFVVAIQDRHAADRERQIEQRKINNLKNRKVAVTREFIASLKQDTANRMFINRLMDVVA
jgi:hypothetical protein